MTGDDLSFGPLASVRAGASSGLPCLLFLGPNTDPTATGQTVYSRQSSQLLPSTAPLIYTPVPRRPRPIWDVKWLLGKQGAWPEVWVSMSSSPSPPPSVTTRDSCPQAAGEGARPCSDHQRWPVSPLLLFLTLPSPYHNVLFIEVLPKRERLAGERTEVSGSLLKKELERWCPYLPAHPPACPLQISGCSDVSPLDWFEP